MGFEWDFDGIYFGIYLGAKLINITPITMVYDTYNYSIHGVYKTRGPTL